MPVSKDTKVQILSDHYKDTFSYVRQYLDIRDRMFLFILVLLALQFFQVSAPDESSKAILDFFETHIGFQITVNKDSLNAVLWFVLLSVVIRYFQANVHVNRQYNYLHKLEEKFTELFEEEVISREGSGYLNDYPLFSKWTNLVYTWVFPALLLISGGLKIVGDVPSWAEFSISHFFSCTFYFMIFLSTVLHMNFLHFGKENQ